MTDQITTTTTTTTTTTITTSPPSRSSSASVSSRASRPTLSLDMSNLPPLSKPTPPSNTLIITDLHDLTLFQPASLSAIRSSLTSIAPLNSFSPLPSLRRIVCSFHNEANAVTARQTLNNEPLMGHTVRPKTYYGEPTPILDEEDSFRPRLLEAPQHDKLFFISPPPSPPHGWVMRTEDPPNKEVHASDLAHALANLKTEQSGGNVDPDTPVSMTSDKRSGSWPATAMSDSRSRSSTVIYNPEDHGSSANLPAVLVEDTTTVNIDSDVEMSPIDIPVSGSVRKLPPKTAMPPMELME